MRKIYHEQWTSKKLDLDTVGLHRADAWPVDIEELFMTKDQVRSTEEAFSTERALDLALEALKQIYTAMPFPAGSKAITAIKQARSAPYVASPRVQEPVKVWCETCEGTGAVYQEHQKGCWVGGEYSCPDCDGNGYYTTPPAAQLQWIGLTDEEMREIYKRTDWDMAGGWEYERAIEAKLKEKNNG